MDECFVLIPFQRLKQLHLLWRIQRVHFFLNHSRDNACRGRVLRDVVNPHSYIKSLVEASVNILDVLWT